MRKSAGILIGCGWLLVTSSLFAAGGGGGGGGGSSGGGMSMSRQSTAQDWYGKGYAAAKADNYDEAIRDFDQALGMRSDYPEALNMMGYSLRKTGKVKEAFSYYEKALSLRPNFPDAREYYGEAYLQSGDLKKAVQQYLILEKMGASQARDLLAFIDAYVNDKPMPAEDL